MKLIINADDFGLSPGVNEAILELSKLGTVTSTTVMTNMPYYKDIVKLLKSKNIGIGLHCNLTQGSPVCTPTSINSIVNNNGEFYSYSELRSRIRQNKVESGHVIKEIQAQYDLLYDIVGNRIDHFDSHQGINKVKMILECIKKVKHKQIKKLGIRTYYRYYLEQSKGHTRIIKPTIFQIGKLGSRAFALNIYFNLLRNSIKNKFCYTDGILLGTSHKTLDLLQSVTQINFQNPTPNITLEIACHPATTSIDLPETKLKESRVAEYSILKSQKFTSILNKLNLINYSNLK